MYELCELTGVRRSLVLVFVLLQIEENVLTDNGQPRGKDGQYQTQHSKSEVRCSDWQRDMKQAVQGYSLAS